MDGIVVRQLKMARRWLVLQQFVDYAVWALAAGLTVLALSHAASLSVPKGRISWPIAIVVPLVLAALAGIYRWRSLKAVAREIDARAKAKDRFLTALALPATETGALCDALRRETSAFVSSLPLRKYLPLEAPRKRALWLLPPLVALGLLEGFEQWRANTLAPELAIARKLVEQVRRNAEFEAEKEKEFQKVAEELRDIERELATSPQPLREALRTIAELEQRLSPQSELSAAETLALAEVLAQNHPKLASDLRSGNNAEAGKAVAQLDPAELARALEQAARHLETRRLRDLADQAPSAARLKLGMMLGSSRGSGDETGRRRFVSALRDMKSGIQGAGQEGAQGLEAAEPREPGDEKSTASALDNAPPGGAPGSENDRGRGEELSQENEPVDQPPGSEDFLAGETGEGPSLVELFHAAGNDDPRARRAYHSAYQAAAPAALDAVSQEQIPAGSRLLVRRYFEAIRPKE
ncbi:MAG: hypothetical protein WBX20_08475 [Terrimicrobiaceae bacterium]